jgi:UDP-N-acetylmuramoyl-L-alanyl-D-glutamate--2,6-diaminopimelate ligase
VKILKDILYKTGILEVSGTTNIAIHDIAFDSRKVVRHGLFVATRGVLADGHDFIGKAIENGAIAIVCEEFPDVLNEKVNYIKVKDASHALGYIASNYFENPSSRIKLIGITGTNGKTTSVTLLYDLFRGLGHKVGMLSTVVNKINDEIIPATHTTPDSIQINALLTKMIDEGCKYCFMEVSSHSVVQNRVTGLEFAGGIFTNITHDHLDYHKTFDEYIKAKKGFFDMLPEEAFALINRDDRNAKVMVQNTKAKINTFSLQSMADFRAKVLESQLSGLLLQIDGHELWVKLIGGFNAYNILGVYGAAMLLGEDKLKVMTILSSIESVEGRFQYIKSGNDITAVIDYAHTPDALQNVLKTIKEIRTGNEQVITVMGCGGDRDAAKRPVMAKIACEMSDKVIMTSDNPRSEDPELILKDMKAGVEIHQAKKTLAITDRREAIKTACSIARPGDIILVAGKGHEKYQEIKGVKYPFDDFEVVKETFDLLQYN